MQLAGETPQDEKWGDIAADKLAAALNHASQIHKQFTLHERKQFRRIIDEQGLSRVIDASAARKVGRLAGVHAVIYGTVSVTIAQEANSSWAAVRGSGHRLFCSVNVSLTMDEVATGGTIAAVAATRQYDSIAQDGKKGLSAEQAARRLIHECVGAFMAKICPRKEKF